MSRTEALRKLLSLGELCRQEIETIMGGDRTATIGALAELHQSGDVLYIKDGRQQTFFKLTNEARESAFKGEKT